MAAGQHTPSGTASERLPTPSSGDLRAVQELLGHQKIETTTVYTKVPDGATRIMQPQRRRRNPPSHNRTGTRRTNQVDNPQLDMTTHRNA